MRTSFSIGIITAIFSSAVIYGSSKSYHTALKIILRLLQEKRTCLVVRQVFGTLRDSCFAILREVIISLELDNRITFNYSPMQINFSNGSKILFRGLDKAEKLKSIHDVSLIWIEEASEINYEGYKELLGRLRHPSLKMYTILTLNPTSKSNWVYKHFFELPKFSDEELYGKRTVKRGGVYYHHSVCFDNKFLPDEYFKRLEEIKEYDPDKYRIAFLGQFGFNGVRVLPQFCIKPHDEVMAAVDKIPRRYKFAGLDFGFETSYDAAVRVAVDHDNKWLYIYWNFYRNKETDDQLAEQLIKAGFAQTRELIKCDSASPRSIAYLQKRGINAIACKKWSEGHRQATLYNYRKIKRFKKIICSDACRFVINELAELTYATDKNGNIIENELSIDAHTLDAIIYSLDAYDVTDPKFSIPRSEFGF